MGAHTGTWRTFRPTKDVLGALNQQVDFFFERMIRCCEVVEKAHADVAALSVSLLRDRRLHGKGPWT